MSSTTNAVLSSAAVSVIPSATVAVVPSADAALLIGWLVLSYLSSSAVRADSFPANGSTEECGSSPMCSPSGPRRLL